MIDKLIKNIFHWPKNPSPIALDNSVVITLDKDIDTYPSVSEFNNEIMPQSLWILIYIIIWGFCLIILFLNTRVYNKNYLVYFFGFFVGLFISIIDFWLKSNLTSVHISADPNNKKPYIFNTPFVRDILPNNIKKVNKFIIPKYASGDYKVLTKNNTYPKDKQFGYIVTANEFIKQENEGNVLGLDYVEFLTKNGNISKSNSHKHYDNIQNKISKNFPLHMDKLTNITRSAYYIGIIVITWGIYISTSKWGNKFHILWIMMTLVMVVIIVGLINSATTIVECQNSIFVKQRILILAISFGITSLLIS